MRRVVLAGLVAAPLLGSALAHASGSPPPRFSPKPIQPQVMANYLDRLFDWSKPDEKPQILLSGGTVLAWIKDPTAFSGWRDLRRYYVKGDLSFIVVPAGQFLLAFPPWTDPASHPGPASRGLDKDYQLAVTEDGFWGIFDRSKSKQYLNDRDLLKYVRKDPSPDIGYGMAIASNTELGPGVALTRGETFRIVSQDDGGNTVIDFDSDLAAIAGKRSQLMSEMKSLGLQLPLTFTVPSGIVSDIDLRDVVDPDVLDAWQMGQQIRVDYRKQIFDHFGDVRIASDSHFHYTCGQETYVKSDRTQEETLDVTADVKGHGGFGSWIDGVFGINAGVKTRRSSEKKEESIDKSLTEMNLWPVVFTDPSGEDRTFFAGVAKTCFAKSANWFTLVIREEGIDRFLHNEFNELGREPEPPTAFVSPTEPVLRGISPGGDPFDTGSGSVKPRCFLQEQEFERIAKGALPGEIEARVAIVLATFPGFGGTRNLQSFFNDKSCSATAGSGG